MKADHHEHNEDQPGDWQVYVALQHFYRDASRIVSQAAGMSQTRLEILHELYHNAELSQADLQKHLGIEGTVITRIVKQMEVEGLITRHADPKDNRYTLVSLTQKMREQNANFDTVQFKGDFGKQLMSGFDAEEKVQLLELIRRLQENLKGMPAPKPPVQARAANRD